MRPCPKTIYGVYFTKQKITKQLLHKYKSDNTKKIPTMIKGEIYITCASLFSAKARSILSMCSRIMSWYARLMIRQDSKDAGRSAVDPMLSRTSPTTRNSCSGSSSFSVVKDYKTNQDMSHYSICQIPISTKHLYNLLSTLTRVFH